MATFRKFDDQQVYQLKTTSAIELVVGDVIAYNPSNKEVTKVETKAEAIALFADQKELFLVAQGDSVTYKEGKEYKSYRLPHVTVNSTGDGAHLIVAYRIDTLANVEGLREE